MWPPLESTATRQVHRPRQDPHASFFIDRNRDRGPEPRWIFTTRATSFKSPTKHCLPQRLHCNDRTASCRAQRCGRRDVSFSPQMSYSHHRGRCAMASYSVPNAGCHSAPQTSIIDRDERRPQSLERTSSLAAHQTARARDDGTATWRS